MHWTLRDNFLWTIVKIFFRQIIDKIILKLGRRSKLLLQDLLLILEFSTYVVTSDDGPNISGFEFGFFSAKFGFDKDSAHVHMNFHEPKFFCLKQSLFEYEGIITGLLHETYLNDLIHELPIYCGHKTN